MVKQNKSVTFLMPGRSPLGPIGGYKVVYEYANRLCERGYEVSILYPLTLNFKQKTIKQRLAYIPRYIKWKLFGVTARRWFNLNPDVKEKIVVSLNWKHIPKSDYYVATEVHTSYYLSQYPVEYNRKLYLIQDYEEWLSSKQFVDQSYQLGLKNIVISDWLNEKVKEAGSNAYVIKNGFDFDYFSLSIPIEQRNPLSITMLYHNDERKGCKYGLDALKKIHEIYPKVKITLFGIPSRPEDLPDWMEYYQNPGKDLHNEIYNQTTIYLAPSIQEGWGLTVGEAMICGAAIVCTDALGFKEMVKNEENGLICKSGDSGQLVEKILYLLENNEDRIKIARNGREVIEKFTWEASVAKFENLLK